MTIAFSSQGRKVTAAAAALITAFLLLCSLIPRAVAEETAGGAPIAQNMSFTTFKGIDITGALEAMDPDGEALCYSVCSEPAKGELRLDSSGSFTYSPAPGKVGADRFTYKVTDESGLCSGEAIVEIRIEKKSTDVYYSDMTGSGAHYAALRLAEEGVFVGEHIGGEYFFEPGGTFSRSEFLAMCMALRGMDPASGIERTGFFDDGDIPMWAKPYIAVALLDGIVSGYETPEGTMVFKPDEPITLSEATSMLNNAIGISDVASVTASDCSCPDWAVQASA
ncbi:MAG: S-layer homology domain-containing protein, partial [Oscillospiraceae bacterium]|nr:S-layer homology domain-containing protein [Oscillospiraceae bacterium]